MECPKCGGDTIEINRESVNVGIWDFDFFVPDEEFEATRHRCIQCGTLFWVREVR